MVPRALAAAEKLKAEHGIDCEVVDVRSLVPLDTQTILGSVAKTHRLFTVEEIRGYAGGAPRLCRLRRMKVSMILTARRFELPRRIFRCRQPIFWKTLCCRHPIASQKRCGGV